MSVFAIFPTKASRLQPATPSWGALDLCLLLTVLWAILFFALLTGYRLIPFDSVEAFYASAYFNAQSLRHGEWPWWNPHVYSGYPQVGDPQGMMFSPLLMLLMMLRENPGVVWFDFSVLLHILIGGWGFLLLCRTYRLTPAASILAAMVYMVGGAASARLQHTPMVLAYACLPWVLFCCHRFTERPTLGKAVALGVSSGFLLTHVVQPTYLFMLTALFYGVTRLLDRRSSITWTETARLIGGIGLAAAIAAAIAGLQVAAALAMLPLSTRGAFSFDTIVTQSLAPRALMTLFWPNIHGTLDGTYSGTQDITESFLYAGVIPLCFLCCYLHRALSDPAWRAEKFFFVAALVLACAFFLGANTPLYRLLYDYLPGMNLFRRPSDGAFLFNFCLAMLTGFAASAATDRADGDAMRRVGIVVLTIAAAWFLAITWLESVKGLSYRPILLLGILSSVLLVIVVVAPRRLIGGILGTGMVVLCLGDFRVFNLPNQLNGHGMDSARYFDDPGVAIRTIKADPQPLAGGLPFRIEASNAGELSATGPVIHGLDSTQGYNPLRVRSYQEIFGAQETGNLPRPFTAAMPSLDSPLFDLSGTRYVLSATPIELLAAGNRHGRFVRVMSEGNVTLWRNRFAYDRILTPSEARVVSPDEPPAAAQFDGVDFSRQLLLYPANAVDATAAQQLAAECHGKASVSDVGSGNNHVEFNVRASAPAWVTVSDLHFPGWRAESDGEPIRIWRANGLYRALCLPAGEHHVRFYFNPLVFIRSAVAHLLPG